MLKNLRWEIQFQWVPAYIGILGNKMADQAAKEAAGHLFDLWIQLEPLEEPDSLQILTATTKSTIHQAIKSEQEKLWETAKYGQKLFRFRVRPGKRIGVLYIGTHRALSLVITQMRTSKIGLRAYLYSINRAETDQCQCGYNRQTVRYILLECRNQVEKQYRMWAGRYLCIDIKQVLCSLTMAVQAAKIIIRTGLLEQF